MDIVRAPVHSEKQVDVTVQNAFGAEYGAVMECVVSRDAGSNIIRVDSLVLY